MPYSCLVLQAPAPEIYTCPPVQQSDKKPGQLEKWQLDQFFDKGFLIVPKFFTDEELGKVIEVKAKVCYYHCST